MKRTPPLMLGTQVRIDEHVDPGVLVGLGANPGEYLVEVNGSEVPVVRTQIHAYPECSCYQCRVKQNQAQIREYGYAIVDAPGDWLTHPQRGQVVFLDPRDERTRLTGSILMWVGGSLQRLIDIYTADGPGLVQPDRILQAVHPRWLSSRPEYRDPHDVGLTLGQVQAEDRRFRRGYFDRIHPLEPAVFERLAERLRQRG